MENKEEMVYYFPAIRGFQDTGYITHNFEDGSAITARVVKSNDSDGFAINLIMNAAQGEKVCDITIDRFAALCVIDVLTKNLINQDDLVTLKINNLKENNGETN